MMVTIFRDNYLLLLSYNPCDIFSYFGVKEMHGLNLIDCKAHENSANSSYIAGWSNFVPKSSGAYLFDDKRFVFINLSRCTNTVKTMGLIMHEMMHHFLWEHDNDVLSYEEEIISLAEQESYEVYDLIKPFLGKVAKEAITNKKPLNQNRMKMLKLFVTHLISYNNLKKITWEY